MPQRLLDISTAINDFFTDTYKPEMFELFASVIVLFRALISFSTNVRIYPAWRNSACRVINSLFQKYVKIHAERLIVFSLTPFAFDNYFKSSPKNKICQV